MDESAIYRRFGRLVRLHRERLDMRQETLAAAIGLSRASVANIEKGRQRIPLHHLYALAKALKVDVRELLPTFGGEGRITTDREIKSPFALSKSETDEIARVLNSIGQTLEEAQDDQSQSKPKPATARTRSA
jgi:transcriptional regulator with XRE-family HTH domain